ncbi:MAG TPA: bifunctional (p)ppGpp synthetase/guanosine-3',5'-bis(diphosphate) 3'-pyrophosphohydrolase [Pyrinomonadaceae bacterium]|nr:bifunctional (p)ppGpp synthetase/guanosine-3',5'-bis(diphosphate) 3'-pyrophosphohydrolase [Chloracidobacterium sp.]MBP9936086.1 bifunctional (p)ppGpp synthetase/guanosine-3',5'-bis(diphosphate) 3'-pyrophosphohydrolase [Pyrinomonadaceae bacterium]MBK7803645.1 bifunctional (p)ppGpp synthetase/guanosine-3',5'-bis(diphosphate) 3'-pyrophosphohydrolase [Chloracidobacterium sp.]MBK9439667.1 bifunctional (p)ppGpp synthetase/guanosine-3',5'-bis(diphosphate) 3'-pyrophosphohydrolase [Chloracidobacterium
MIRIEDVIKKVTDNRPLADVDLIRRAYLFSALHHRGQTRASGEPYLVHPLEVAEILADMRLDEVSVSTGLLHDVVEDTLVDLDTIRSYFGDEITLLVDGLTKIAQISSLSKEKQQAENVRKMVLAMITDVRVVLIKLADRLHNMRTMQFLKPEKRARISQETLDIYAPIAHRLGMGKMRSELEDLSFQNLYPDEYKKLAKEVDARRPELESALHHIRETIAQKLTEYDVPFVAVEGRVKRLYSLWKKLKKQKIRIEQVYDLIAARIITPNDRKYCYLALSVIHDGWTPVPERFKDWIGVPRDNLYQSLHTSVIGDGGVPFEVQIRTQEMHLVAEEGVAAHWKYKESSLGTHKDDDTLDELRRTVEKLLLPLVETNEENEDSEDFIESLKLDLFPKDVYAFTPMGKVIQLPRGATPLDFAYAIHSGVGDKCTGAKINGRIVPLRTELQNGDMVEILTTQNAKPTRDWLNHVVTSKARSRIRHWITQQQREESVEIGRKLLEKEADRFRLAPKKFLTNDSEMTRIANEYGLSRPEDLLASVGYGKVLPRNIIAKFLGAEKFDELDPEKKKDTRISNGVKAVKKFIGLGEDAIVVKGVDNLLTSRAKCCNPLRGEDIVGYISLGKGIVVHNKRCKNMGHLMVNKERIVEVEWARSEQSEKQSVQLLVTTENRTGMLAGITNAIADIKTGIRDARANVSKDDIGLVEVTVEVFDKKHLDKVIGAIGHVPGVIAVERINS